MQELEDVMDIERQMLDDPLLSEAFKAWVRDLLADREASRSSKDQRFHLEGLRYWLKRACESCAAGDLKAALRRLYALDVILQEMEGGTPVSPPSLLLAKDSCRSV